MSLNFEKILKGVGAYVAVADSGRRIVFSNRGDARGARVDDKTLGDAIDAAFSDKTGFHSLETKLSLPGLSPSGDTPEVRVDGQYAELDGQPCMILTITDITDLQDSVQALSDALAKAREEAVTKTSYLANMSHEIRTPVNAIAGFSRLLAQTDDKHQQAAYVEVIENNNRLLLQLIDDVLDIAKMEEGALKFRKKEVELNNLIRSVENTVRMRVQPKTVLNYVFGAAECKVETDPGRLTQVLINLLTNACKFTPRGSITFGYELHSDCVYFFVKDTGVGISRDKQQLLFKRFSKQNDSEPGTGLGLSICKEIVDTLGGEIGEESAGEGKGSLFWFTLPVSPADSDIPVMSSASMRTPASAPAPKAAGTARHTILIAEDNESNYLLFQMILEKDFNLVHAWNGREAIDLFAEVKPDLILMDINMPIMDGYEATRHIRQSSETVPVIAVTAYAFSSDKARIMENGFNSYVSKPVNTDRLLTEIRRLLS